MDSFTKHTSRRYAIELGGSMAVYAVVLFAAIPLMEQFADLLTRSLIILTPMIPITLAAIAIYRHLMRIDEYQRLQAFRIISIAAAGTALLSMGYGFLELAGLPKLSMMIVWPVMGLLWACMGLAIWFQARRES